MSDTQMKMLSNLDVGSLQKLKELDTRRSERDKLLVYSSEESMPRTVDWDQILGAACNRLETSKKKPAPMSVAKTKQNPEEDIDEERFKSQLDKIMDVTVQESQRPDTANWHGGERKKHEKRSKVNNWS